MLLYERLVWGRLIRIMKEEMKGLCYQNRSICGMYCRSWVDAVVVGLAGILLLSPIADYEAATGNCLKEYGLFFSSKRLGTFDLSLVQNCHA